MVGRRRLSETISEGDGISVLVHVAAPPEAAAAAGHGAEGLSLNTDVAGVAQAADLPLLFRGGSPDAADAAGADAWLLVAESYQGEGAIEAAYRRTRELGLECVVDVRDEDELELVLERIDPEIFLLSPRDADEDEDPLDRVLSLLPDVPAGKLAVAELRGANREEIVALERAGVDAVLVSLPDLTALAAAEQAQP